MTEKEEQALELEWVKFKEETLARIDEDNKLTPSSRFGDKIRENPFVPVGAAATVAALCTGLYYMKKGNQRQSQLMMRARIAAQGFTVIAMLGSIYLGAGRR